MRMDIKREDTSQYNVYSISKGADVIIQPENLLTDIDATQSNVGIDREVANLLNWLAEQQGISPEVALKKAVATAAYIYDVTAGQGGKLLVQRRDNSVGEIVLK